MTTIFPIDRDLAETWRDLGAIPDDLSTRQHAAKVIGSILAAHDALRDVLLDITDTPEVPEWAEGLRAGHHLDDTQPALFPEEPL